jgi:hypothetical protein
LLAGLLVVLGGLLWVEWPRIFEGNQPAAPTARPQAPAPAPRAASPGRALGDIGLEALDEPVPAPVDSGRNPFRFAAGVRDVTGTGGAVAAVPPVMLPPVPVVPQGPPPIPLRFIGLVDAPGQTARLAVLSDGRNVFHGREGDIIDGRYRIVRIGVESIEMSHVDGRGRQTIRLSGSG